jgi:putative methanogenesis marker protein 17
MAAANKVFVESLDPADPFNFGIISYKIIADTIFADLAVSGALRLVRILIDIKTPFFYIWGEVNTMETPIRLADITSITQEDRGIHLVIEDETYAPDILRLLWAQFGRERLTQIDRWNLLIPAHLTSVEALKQFITVNPRERIVNKVLDAFNRLIPEGFRVRQSTFDHNLITIIASENPIQDEWLDRAKEALRNPPSQIPEEYSNKYKREPKKIQKKIVPWKTHEFQESLE